jgi:hypothetical protein
MAFDFPNSPSLAQEYTSNGVTFAWNGFGWLLKPPASVLKSGDTMTGDLTLSKADPFITLNKAASGQRSAIFGNMGGLTRWRMSLGTATAESGSNAGSDFAVSGFSDAGNAIADYLTINRATGQTTLGGHLVPVANGTLNLGSASFRWGTVYTSDLSLKNDVGDWTIVEGEDDLFLYNNKRNKTYKFALIEVDQAPPKKA